MVVHDELPEAKQPSGSESPGATHGSTIGSVKSHLPQRIPQLQRVPVEWRLEPAARLRPTAPTATAPEGLGGRRRAGRPSSAPAWASPPATASGGARRR